MRNRQFIRQWKILRRLAESRYGATYRDLMEVLETDGAATLRTIQRDLNFLGPVTKARIDFAICARKSQRH